jgi:hypothetical protein
VSTETDIRRNFVLAIDDAIPPAPWLEEKVRETLRREARPPRGRVTPLVRELRLAAAVAALLIVALALSMLLFGVHLRSAPVPAHHPSASPSPTISFTPSPAVRDPKWPAGGPVPASLQGCWQSTKYANNPFYTLCIAGYSFDFGQGAGVGNVVVNGSEIDFISDTCTPDGNYGYDRYRFQLTNGVLMLVKFPSPPPPTGTTSSAGAWGNCGWRMAGTYTLLASS